MQELIFGLLIGLLVAIPVGPTAVLCIRRTLLYGRTAGLFSGLGAAAVDGIFGIIAGFGYAWVMPFIHEHNFWIKIIGSAILLILGVHIFLQSEQVNRRKVKMEESPLSLAKYSVSAALITGSNPLTILTFGALFSSLHHISAFSVTTGTIHYISLGLLCIGIFCGSMLWWIVLLKGVWFLRVHIDIHKYLAKINKVSGVILIIFGAHALIAQIIRLVF